jgi:hypothetical protein
MEELTCYIVYAEVKEGGKSNYRYNEDARVWVLVAWAYFATAKERSLQST